MASPSGDMDSLRSLKCRAVLDENTDSLHVEIWGNSGSPPDEWSVIVFDVYDALFRLEGVRYPTSAKSAQPMHLHLTLEEASIRPDVFAGGHIRLDARGWLPDKYLIKLETISKIVDSWDQTAEWEALEKKSLATDDDKCDRGDSGCQAPSDGCTSSSSDDESETTADTIDITKGCIASGSFGPLMPTTFKGLLQLGEHIVRKEHPGAKLYKVHAHRTVGNSEENWNVGSCRNMRIEAWFVDFSQTPPVSIDLITDYDKVWSAPEVITWFTVNEPRPVFEARDIQFEPTSIAEDQADGNIFVLSRQFALEDAHYVFHRPQYKFYGSSSDSRSFLDFQNTQNWFDAYSSSCTTAVDKLDPAALERVASAVKYDQFGIYGEWHDNNHQPEKSNEAAASPSKLYEVDKILGHMWDTVERTWLYHIQWYDPKDWNHQPSNTWEPTSSFDDPNETLGSYWLTIGAGPGPVPVDTTQHVVGEQSSSKDLALLDRVAKLEATLAEFKLNTNTASIPGGTTNSDLDKKSDGSHDTSNEAAIFTPDGSQSVEDGAEVSQQTLGTPVIIDDKVFHERCVIAHSWRHSCHDSLCDGYLRDSYTSQANSADSWGGRSMTSPSFPHPDYTDEGRYPMMSPSHPPNAYDADEGGSIVWDHETGSEEDLGWTPEPDVSWSTRTPTKSAGNADYKYKKSDPEPLTARADNWFSDGHTASTTRRTSSASDVKTSDPLASTSVKSSASHAAAAESESKSATQMKLTYIIDYSSGERIWLQDGLLEKGCRPWIDQPLHEQPQLLYNADGDLSAINYNGKYWTKGPVFPANSGQGAHSRHLLSPKSAGEQETDLQHQNKTHGTTEATRSLHQEQGKDHGEDVTGSETSDRATLNKTKAMASKMLGALPALSPSADSSLQNVPWYMRTPTSPKYGHRTQVHPEWLQQIMGDAQPSPGETQEVMLDMPKFLPTHVPANDVGSWNPTSPVPRDRSLSPVVFDENHVYKHVEW